MVDFFCTPTFTLELGKDSFVVVIGFFGDIKETSIKNISNFSIEKVSKNGLPYLPTKKELAKISSKISYQIKHNFDYIVSVIYKELIELAMLQSNKPKV